MDQQQQKIKMPTYYAVPPAIKDNVAMGLEHVTDMYDDIHHLHEMHFAETEKVYLDEPFNPNYPLYMQMEKDGRFVCFTVRINWQIVAYLQYYVFRDQHSMEVLHAREDALYVHPMVRGQKIAPMLLGYAEDALKTLGCRYVGMTSKHPIGAPDLGEFLSKRGYRHIAAFYMKDLEK